MVTRIADRKLPPRSRAADWVAAARQGMLMAYLAAFGALVVLRGIDIALRG
jgi:hypothetical protein